ncbi:MAG: hypothetical protein J7M26_02620, partial [Armatimonadetes bacterium]|nr:hypothetical protein [Armatimonadota bacterium]
TSPFGMNHAYAWDEWLVLSRRMGINWVRDWTLKWQWLEPERGKMELAKADFFINRPLRLGMKELVMFPFPSSVWAAEEPPKRPAKQRKLYRPIETAWRPRDVGAFKHYVQACVERYRDRIHDWEVFNESIFTSYSLPRSYGYEAADYVPLLAAAHEAIRAGDPKAYVIGGYSAPPGAHLGLYDTFIKLHGPDYCDAVSIHEYPGGEPEGCEQAAMNLVRKLEAAGKPRPLWLTEFAYYADDDVAPTKNLSSWPPLVEGEKTQAEWLVRYCLLMMSARVERIFFHIWTTRVNYDGGQGLFFEADGEPHKVAVAVSAMAQRLGPEPEFLQRVDLGSEGRVCLLFRRGNTIVGAVWDAWTEDRCRGSAPRASWYDITGAPLAKAPQRLTASPVFFETRGGVEELARKLGRWARVEE